MFCSRQRQLRLLSINTDFCQILSLVNFSFSPYGLRKTPRGFEVYYQKLIVQLLFNQESIVCAFFRLPRHWSLSLPSHQIYLEHPWLQLASTKSYATTTDGSCLCSPSLLLKFVSLQFLVLSILVMAEFSLQPPPPLHHLSFCRRIYSHDIRITFAQLTPLLFSLEKMSFLF